MKKLLIGCAVSGAVAFGVAAIFEQPARSIRYEVPRLWPMVEVVNVDEIKDVDEKLLKIQLPSFSELVADPEFVALDRTGKIKELSRLRDNYRWQLAGKKELREKAAEIDADAMRASVACGAARCRYFAVDSWWLRPDKSEEVYPRGGDKFFRIDADGRYREIAGDYSRGGMTGERVSMP